VSAADKAWCAKAKPVSLGLNNLLGLSVAQLEDLVNQALALKASAPAPLQAPLDTLATTGQRFLSAVKAGQATISTDGIAAWANQHLSPDQQQQFLLAAGDVTQWITATC
jgi:hypothetical protein